MLFVGSIYPDNILEDIINEKTHADFAANTFQSGIIEGLQKCYKEVRIITSPVTSPYPKSQTLIYHKQECDMLFSDKPVSVILPGFINLPIIKMASEYFSLKHTLKKVLNENETVYVYALHSPFLLALLSCRKIASKVCVIIPDLPEHMSHNNGFFRRLMKRLNKHIINKCLKVFHFYVLFSRFMARELPLNGKSWITVEGLYSPTILPYHEKESKKTILYSGIISSKYSVFDLIEAFHRITGDNYQLWLCGSCPTEKDKLDAHIKQDARIKYFGLLQKDEVRDLQVRATLLVNPRHSNEEFTKYSFPSKTMEYLASGTPTIMCKLPAIPEEYDEYLFYFDDESIEGYANKIVEICNWDSIKMQEHGARSRKFILQNKNCNAQAKRIFDMVEG